ncbi:hydroxylacyl-CoA dehydrogenase [Amycolatopsis mediterranei S699]|uniref:L-gulonate 3-dehydrogenase n=2 Tax=Amycolatopsis mediterranei TaxID=33910 RepID=A0A0H3DDF7_AMYMU|nr:3-hydroxyacyl-CoA dehydrogenase NAD-binding domain-containing protein [Amycolatopsis mediterranei]ADJ48103.1 hydroxylacyl-CoA dehydrogenase [Amycolatopsis mediterranei U32]AEK45004.1 hydroxylacyl-CoA dehydrogenase [Amycolatopsis mediterranei S699]AFO79814.1 hydroxylacyl-CoA dehydrogenase [Amycolatopsis mediterranei S699]AGT86942.1 hydroxylacyl-CoA dehydrogenase [Amycolatopsis mediterranei RB]KDO10588.1 hydroxylacyl-CoA dehydrogenase [Amycolatopsis mediterranei]
MKEFRTAAVIGAGTIGLSWTALFAGHGLTVRVSDPRPDLADAVLKALEEFTPHLAARGLDVTGLADRVILAGDVAEAVRDADVVQENGPENVEFKKDLFKTLLEEAPKHALLLSSSSAIPSTAFTGDLADASRVLIGHPFNPPHLIPLVEVVPGERTSEESVRRAVGFYTFLGRTPVVERKEIPGFVGNRLQNALSREAIYLVEQGVVTPEDLDKVITNSLGIRWATVGPFLGSHLGGGPGGYRHMAEHIGKSMKKMWAGLGNPSQSPEEQEQLIEAVETAYGSSTYSELAETRDRKQLAVLNAVEEN